MQTPIRKQEAEVQKTDGENNVADILTKNVKSRNAGVAHGGNEIQ